MVWTGKVGNSVQWTCVVLSTRDTGQILRNGCGRCRVKQTLLALTGLIESRPLIPAASTLIWYPLVIFWKRRHILRVNKSRTNTLHSPFRCFHCGDNGFDNMEVECGKCCHIKMIRFDSFKTLHRKSRVFSISLSVSPNIGID